ncbi:MAG TPA: tRNA (guanine(46)-N(7))-methyltransferase TrmB [Hypericibacter adhaerens]|jgi:tRNA (guanine-N7-)-methyltransferase|uniref:tRNA (guanine-N(7)-)-methyltransferase n=1 Tax=Hypericibacter adhaerens TaxID=2602016 RepID=A0A5J6N5B2_9PROT|nr:tRNA (guanine(46)-N(7))-methyltransferase TrmB [Hypericibacter adhaerens]QEX25302.1 tRNA (guanine-N(7)-)-methyltransferase [Hypericibacter adhaerens]HWA43470.1 tRNA (guanine(46)-N(7))-methyltransferase TrmB [Hypericibacter adhaerens]
MPRRPAAGAGGGPDPAAGDAAGRLHFHGRRKGRKLRPGQQKLMQAVLPRLRVELPPAGASLDLATLKGEAPSPDRELWLEVGFGSGEHLAWQAANHPEVTIIGCEVFENGIARALGYAVEQKLGNLRLFPDDARKLMDRLPDGALSRVFILFPDPWPKARHAERRFVGRANLDRLARLMRPGAELRMASDDPGQIRWMLGETIDHPAFAWLAAGPKDWRQRPADWPQTRYEAKALREGRKPAYFRFRRR